MNTQFNYLFLFLFKNKERKLISPIPRGGRRISSSASLSRRPFGYYLPIAGRGTIVAAKWSSNGQLEAAISKCLAQGQNNVFVSFQP